MKKTMSGVVAAALILSACGGAGSGTVAASVGDADITVSDVRAFTFEETASLDSGTFAQYLNYLIQWTVMEQAADEEFGIDPTDAETDTEMARALEEDFGGLTVTEFAEQQQLSESVVRRLIRLGLIQEGLADALADTVEEPAQEEVDAAIAGERAGLTEVCVRHVLVATADEAEAAIARIESGEEFGDVAAEVSTDPSAAENMGDLGCALAQQYVDEFRDASVAMEIDAVSDPVETQFGFHVLQVYERTEPDETELSSQDDVRQSLVEAAEAVAIQDWLLDKVKAADVTVEEEFGTWTVEPTPTVEPPAS